jgi:hypothetical protein
MSRMLPSHVEGRARQCKRLQACGRSGKSIPVCIAKAFFSVEGWRAISALRAIRPGSMSSDEITSRKLTSWDLSARCPTGLLPNRRTSRRCAAVQGTYIQLDVNKTLSTIMVDDMPDSTRFFPVVVSLRQQPKRRGNRITALWRVENVHLSVGGR